MNEHYEMNEKIKRLKKWKNILLTCFLREDEKLSIGIDVGLGDDGWTTLHRNDWSIFQNKMNPCIQKDSNQNDKIN